MQSSKMSAATLDPPKITIEMEISPDTHHFSSDEHFGPTTVEIGDMTDYISVPASPNEIIVLQPGQRSKRLQVAFSRGAS